MADCLKGLNLLNTSSSGIQFPQGRYIQAIMATEGQVEVAIDSEHLEYRAWQLRCSCFAAERGLQQRFRLALNHSRPPEAVMHLPHNSYGRSSGCISQPRQF